MIFRQTTLDGIRDGTVTLAFRRWIRPSVRAGGTLLTPAGELEIRTVAPTAPETISSADVKQAGYTSRESLLADLETGYRLSPRGAALLRTIREAGVGDAGL